MDITLTANDIPRLDAQRARVWDAITDGEWHTLSELSETLGDPEASVSARLRDFRKARYGEHIIERRRVENGNGLHQYRLVRNKRAFTL